MSANGSSILGWKRSRCRSAVRSRCPVCSPADRRGPGGPKGQDQGHQDRNLRPDELLGFVKISADAGIVGWGEMLKDDAKACASLRKKADVQPERIDAPSKSCEPENCR